RRQVRRCAGAARRWRVVVHISHCACARCESAHRAASPRLARACRQGASLRSRPCSSLGDTAGARIHDGVVTLDVPAGELVCSHDSCNGYLIMKQADIMLEYGPFDGIDAVHGVSHDGRNVWFASGDKLNVLDPETGTIARSIAVAADA